MAYKKKLYRCRPLEKATKEIDTQRTKERIRRELCDPQSIERGVRQLLADKVSGNLVGIWLLIPEYLRLGAWDMLRTWSGRDTEHVEPRLALQLVNERALCVNGIRYKRTISQKGFELVNGLPFVAADSAIHQLLMNQRVSDSQRLQIELGKIRQTFDHFNGRIITIDPHRIESYSKRQMIRRKKDKDAKPVKMAQTFFCLDSETQQPICFTSSSSARTITQATKELLGLAGDILKPGTNSLVMADNEHYTVNLFDWVDSASPFNMIVPMPNGKATQESIKKLSDETFVTHWAGYATAKAPYKMVRSKSDAFHQFIERNGERPEEYSYKAFLCTSDRNEVEELTKSYPERWHIEEFFKNYQAMGWNRVGTMNLNVQYGKMTLALIAQAASYMMRKRIGKPFSEWDSEHFAQDFLKALEGDIRVKGDTIIITYYNAPYLEQWRINYEHLPEILDKEGVDPSIPWLYGYKLEFRFK